MDTTTTAPRKRRMTAQRKQDAAVLAELAERSPAKGTTRQQKIATLETVRRNLAQETTDPTNPRSSAAAKVRFIAQLEAELESSS